jgi:hypothetical protein
MKSQKQSVFDAICQVKNTLTKDLSKEEIRQVCEIVLTSIEDGETRFDSADKYNTVELRFTYVKGMVNNWLRKSPELNGGAKYEPAYKKGPQKSETLKALEALAEKHPDNDEVQAALTAQIELEMSEKAKKKEKTINVDALPEHLKSLAVG